jgi:hypothetical protein
MYIQANTLRNYLYRKCSCISIVYPLLYLECSRIQRGRLVPLGPTYGTFYLMSEYMGFKFNLGMYCTLPGVQLRLLCRSVWYTQELINVLLFSARKFYSGLSNMSSHSQYLETRFQYLVSLSSIQDSAPGRFKFFSRFSVCVVKVVLRVQCLVSSSCTQGSVLGEFKLYSGFRAWWGWVLFRVQ